MSRRALVNEAPEGAAPLRHMIENGLEFVQQRVTLRPCLQTSRYDHTCTPRALTPCKWTYDISHASDALYDVVVRPRGVMHGVKLAVLDPYRVEFEWRRPAPGYLPEGYDDLAPVEVGSKCISLLRLGGFCMTLEVSAQSEPEVTAVRLWFNGSALRAADTKPVIPGFPPYSEVWDPEDQTVKS